MKTVAGALAFGVALYIAAFVGGFVAWGQTGNGGSATSKTWMVTKLEKKSQDLPEGKKREWYLWYLSPAKKLHGWPEVGYFEIARDEGGTPIGVDVYILIRPIPMSLDKPVQVRVQLNDGKAVKYLPKVDQNTFKGIQQASLRWRIPNQTLQAVHAKRTLSLILPDGYTVAFPGSVLRQLKGELP